MWTGIIVVVILFCLLYWFVDREIYFYEGVHLGPRVQAWLYDRWSKKYDVGKRESQIRDTEMLARPLLDLLNDIPEPFILDFATGTGRLSYALLSQPEFKGHIIALDLSQGMLEQAAVKLNTIAREDPAPANANAEFIRHVSLPLPFPDGIFDVVCCLEVLELFPNMDEPLAELTRVLRPGGVLLSSRGTEESGRRAKVKSKADYSALLKKYGVDNLQIVPWWKLFDRVIAVKNGKSAPVGAKKLSEVLRCGACGQIQWKHEANALKCQNCGRTLFVTQEGIVLN